MASSTTIDVDDFGNDIKEVGMESLDFQDYPHDTPDSPEKGQTTHFTRFPNSAADSDDEADDKEKLIKEDKSGNSSFWTFAYYQQFFDVETAQVGQRIVGSMVPRPGSNYLMHHIRPNPDLYGPFWICTTLVFTTAIAGNLANYFSMAGKAYHWQYDFHKVTFAATAIFSYWWLVPLLLWAVLWWRGSQAKFSFLEMLCVYGYSLAIYVPISILWAIQVSWLQWTLVLVGAALSGSVLLLTFWPAIREDSQKIAIGLMVFIFIMHAALAAGFVLYFFYVPASSSTGASVAPPPIPINETFIKTGNTPTGSEKGNFNSGSNFNNKPEPRQLQRENGVAGKLDVPGAKPQAQPANGAAGNAGGAKINAALQPQGQGPAARQPVGDVRPKQAKDVSEGGSQGEQPGTSSQLSREPEATASRGNLQMPQDGPRKILEPVETGNVRGNKQQLAPPKTGESLPAENGFNPRKKRISMKSSRA